MGFLSDISSAIRAPKRSLFYCVQNFNIVNKLHRSGHQKGAGMRVFEDAARTGENARTRLWGLKRWWPGSPSNSTKTKPRFWRWTLGRKVNCSNQFQRRFDKAVCSVCGICGADWRPFGLAGLLARQPYSGGLRAICREGSPKCLITVMHQKG